MAKYHNYEVKAMMLLENEKGQTLMMQNNHKESIIYGYVNPPAGHLEPEETVIDLVKREVFEEIGVTNLQNIEIKGIINVKGFKEVPILMFVVKAEISSTIELLDKGEGTPLWVVTNRLDDYKMLEDVKKILELASATRDGDIFNATSEFNNKKLVSFKIQN